ncbi:MAG: (2Fe-2S)-binding protein [Deltaproteobacteria bacterium]|nr:(2Fe-2S)-binding protein [Deltaproteobacteria bacterium]
MQRIQVSTNINGKAYSFEVEPRLLLVDLIRDKAGLTGTHVGCDTGNCGACTVLMDGLTVKSCQVLAPRAQGAEIRTVEGLAGDGELHPIQEAFWECDGLECGFCTPGMLMTTVAFLEENSHPADDEIRRAYSGNLCRCTGYLNIIKAVKQAALRLRSAGAPLRSG